jgi:hypothetical protein
MNTLSNQSVSKKKRDSSKQGAWSKIGFSPKAIRWLMNIWGPFVGARIHIEEIDAEFRYVRVRMKQSWYNGNYVGVHFGGSLFAMTDPFYMLMVLHNLGSGYIVWDKRSTIEYKAPGRGYVYAEFRLSTAQIQAFKAEADTLGKIEPELVVEVKDKSGMVVATSHKTLYIRRKTVRQSTDRQSSQPEDLSSEASTPLSHSIAKASRTKIAAVLEPAMFLVSMY